MSTSSLSLGVVLGATVSGSFSKAINTSQGQLTQLGKELSNLNKEQAKLQGFSKRNDDSKNALSALNIKKQELALSQKNKAAILAEISAGRLKGVEAAKALKNANAEIKRNTQEVTKLDAKYQRVVNDMRLYGEQARKAGFSLVGHEARLKKIGSEIENNTKRAQRYNQIISKKGEIGEAYGSLKAGAGFAVATGTMLGIPLKSFSDYEAGMQRIGATAGMSREQIAAMRNELLAVSEAKGIAHDKLQNTLGVMVAGGMDVGFALQIQNTSADLIKAYDVAGEDIGQASLALKDNLGFAAKDIALGWDIIARAGQEGSFEIPDMAKAMPSIGASMKALKVGGEGGLASVGAMLQIAKIGAGSPTQGATNLDNYLSKMLSQETEKRANEMGFSMIGLVSKAQKEGKNPIEESIKKVMQVTGGDQAKISELFSDTEVQKFIRPMMQNWDRYEEIRDIALNKSKNAVEKDAADMDATTDAHLNKMGAAWGRFKEKIGEKVSPVFNVLFTGIEKTLGLVTRIADTKLGGAVITGILAFGAAASIAFSMYQIYRIGKLGFAIMGLRKEILGLGGTKSVWDRFGQVFGGGAWSMRNGGWKKNFTRGGAFGMAGRALGAAGGAFGLYDLWQSDKNAGTKKQSKLQVGESYLRGAMSGAAIGMMFGPVGAVVGSVLGLIYTAVVRNWDKVKSVTMSKLSQMKQYVGRVWQSVKNDPIRALGAVVRAIINFQPLGLFYRAFAGVLSYFGIELPGTLTGLGKSIVKGLINGISEMFPSLGAKLRELGEMIPDSVKRFLGINSPSRVFIGIGRSVMKGLDQGIGRNRQPVLNTLGQTAKSMTQAMRPKLDAPAPAFVMPDWVSTRKASAGVSDQAAAQSAPQYIFHISQQAGEDAEALARRIVTMIEQKAGLRRRSALADLA